MCAIYAAKYIEGIKGDEAWIPAVVREMLRGYGVNVPRAYQAAVALHRHLWLKLCERMASRKCLICDQPASADAPFAIYCEEHGDKFLDWIVSSDELFARFHRLVGRSEVRLGSARRQLDLELDQAFAFVPAVCG